MTRLVLVCLALLLAWLILPILVVTSQSVADLYLPLIYKNYPPPTATPVPGRLMISEILYDLSGDEPAGEWFEVYNPGGLPVDLGGHKIWG